MQKFHTEYDTHYIIHLNYIANTMTQLPWLDPNIIAFPDTNQALVSPNGLLAAGGELTPKWLLKAYSQGIFPWFSEGEPILWWSPSPRTIIDIDQLHISKSLKKALKKKNYSISFDKAFREVVDNCAQPRQDQEDVGTWITPEILDAYHLLHKQGYAHSVEVWNGDNLVGGVYGVALGKVFFGESMFSHQTNSSKIALVHLVEQLKEWHYVAIDCQVHNNHLESLGATQVPRMEFETLIKQQVTRTPCHWGAKQK